jgi:hypothetical protein
LLDLAFFDRCMSAKLYPVANDALDLGRVIRAIGADA